VEVRGVRNVIDECRDGNRIPSLLISGDLDVGDRAAHEIAQAHEAAPEHCPSAAVDGNRAALQRLERQHGRVQEIACLVSNVRGTLCVVRVPSLGGQARVFCHRFGDSGIEATIERMKFLGRDRRVLLDGQLGHSLPYVPVVVDHLRHRKTQRQQVTPMAGGADSDMARRVGCAGVGRA
jgi:hypothetical protein